MGGGCPRKTEHSAFWEGVFYLSENLHWAAGECGPPAPEGLSHVGRPSGATGEGDLQGHPGRVVWQRALGNPLPHRASTTHEQGLSALHLNMHQSVCCSCLHWTAGQGGVPVPAVVSSCWAAAVISKLTSQPQLFLTYGLQPHSSLSGILGI